MDRSVRHLNKKKCMKVHSRLFTLFCANFKNIWFSVYRVVKELNTLCAIPAVHSATHTSSYVRCWNMSSGCSTPMIRNARSTILLKSGSKEPVKNLNLSLSLSLSLRIGSWRCGNWLSDWKCLRTLTGIMRMPAGYAEIWKETNRSLSAWLQCLSYSSHLQGLVHSHLYFWTLWMMIQMTRLLKFPFVVTFYIFCDYEYAV